MGIFKAYDIRGKVPSELDAPLARKIGNAFARLLKAKKIVVGRDMRRHSPELQAAVIEGARDAGADVIDIGLASTPMAYFAIGALEKEGVDGGLNVTASHNPGEYNGMKLCSRGARPISGATGIQEIERMCREPAPPPVAARGKLERRDLLARYADHVVSFAKIERPLGVAIDAANGMGAHTLPPILARLASVTAQALFMELDGAFPNHEANPIKEQNLADVKALVLRTRADVGVAFDGDADRCAFVDEKGRSVPSDLMTALLARELLAERGGVPVVYDLRSSWAVKEEIARAGGVPLRDRVGHSFIKATMRSQGAVFGGELSGHFYFADNFVSDSGEIAFVTALSMLSRSRAPFSARVEDLRRYHATGEINFHIDDKAGAIAALKSKYANGRQDELDGITVEFGDLAAQDWWWFNVRASNTEPVLRLNLEARTAEMRDRRRDELIALLGEPER